MGSLGPLIDGKFDVFCVAKNVGELPKLYRRAEHMPNAVLAFLHHFSCLV